MHLRHLRCSPLFVRTGNGYAPVAVDIFEEAPGVSPALRTVELDFREDLRAGELDLVLYPGRADETSSGYDAQALPIEEFIVAVRSEHPLLERYAVSGKFGMSATSSRHRHGINAYVTGYGRESTSAGSRDFGMRRSLRLP